MAAAFPALLILAGCLQPGLSAVGPVASEARPGAGERTLPANLPAVLTVSTAATVQHLPDLAVVTLAVTAQRASAAAALSAQAAIMASVSDLLRAEGIAEDDLQTSALSLVARYDYPADAAAGPDRDPEVAGYLASSQIRLTVRDLSRLGTLLDRLGQAGTNTISGVMFGIGDDSVLRDRARRQAMAQAIARARSYAEASGLEVSRIVSIEEEGSDGTDPHPASRPQPGSSTGAATRMAARALNVTAVVRVVFELE